MHVVAKRSAATDSRVTSAPDEHESDHNWIEDFAEDPPPPPSIFEVVVSKPTLAEPHRPAARAQRPDPVRSWLVKHVVEDSGLLTAGVMIVVSILVLNFVVRDVRPDGPPDPNGVAALAAAPSFSLANPNASRASPPGPLAGRSPVEPLTPPPAAAARAGTASSTRSPIASTTSKPASRSSTTGPVQREEAPQLAERPPALSSPRQMILSSSAAWVPPVAPERPKEIAAPPASPATPAKISDTNAIEGVIEQYRLAFVTLNPYRVEEFWPSVNTVALTKSFDQLESQSFDLGSCRISVAGSRAEAICQGTATFVTKVGSRRARTEPRRWVFQLSRPNDRWMIDNVDAR